MLLLVSLLLTFALQTQGAAPVISGQVGQATLRRDQSLDLRLYELHVDDPDYDPFVCSVVLVTPPTTIFQVTTRADDNGVYWVYFIHNSSDTVTEDSYNLDIACTDGTDTSNTVQVRVDIINNSPPILTASNSEHVLVDISTTYLPRTVLHVIGFQDPDNDTVTCTTSPPAGFSVTADCVIQNEIDLRSVTASSVSITVSVSDGVNAPVTARVTLSFTNDNQAPMVTFPSDLVTADENVMGGVTLFTVNVIDDSSTPSVRCHFSPAADSSYFDVTVSLPAVSIKLASGKQFDYETSTIQFVITCLADDGYLQTTASTTLLILDVNEAPYFRSVPVQVTVSEGPAGTVSVLPAYSTVDPDNDSLMYTIVAGGTYSNLFSIRTSDGTLTNQQQLERDNVVTNPVIKVMVSDPGGLSATSDVIIHLTDINDNPPAFNQTSYEFKVGLSSAKGDQVGAIGVTDPDLGSNARTDLVMTSDSPPGYFNLEPDGSLFLIKDLDVGFGTVFTLTIKATDNGSPILTSTSVISVTWYPGPTIPNLPAVTYCHEDLQMKTKLFDLNVVDTGFSQLVCVREDSRSTSVKAFDVMDMTGNRNFAVVYTGAISLSASDVSTYDVAVRCYDPNGQVIKVLKVGIVRNTAPVFTQCTSSYPVTVDASAIKAGDVAYTVPVRDVDNDTLTFSVVSTLFFIGTYSGDLKATDSLRYVTANDHMAYVTVKDVKHTSYCSLVIHFINVNRVPVFSNLLYTLEVPENTAVGSNLYVITVTDSTVYTTTGNIDITWTSADKYKFSLAVSGLRATLSLGQTLDYESGKQQYSLTFTASDGYLTSDPATLTLVVTPVNEPPYFDGGNTYYATFQEISSSVVGLGCNTKDPDTGDTVTLSLSGTSANLFSVEDLDNCQLTLKAEYDLDTGAPSTLTLGLKATDKAGLSASATLTVHIVEINDNTPKFAGPSTLMMYYGMKAADVIGGVTANDIDLGTNGAVYYSVQKEPANADIANTYISFLSNGRFIVRQSIDNVITTAETFQYVILATDGGIPQRSSTTTVNIVYDPLLTTTTTTSTTSTTEALTTTEVTAASSLLDQPLFIGLMVGLICLFAILAAAVIFALCKYFNANKSFSPVKETPKKESLPPKRSSTPVRPSRVSVYGLENQGTGGWVEGRKVSRMVQLPLPTHY